MMDTAMEGTKTMEKKRRGKGKEGRKVKEEERHRQRKE